MLDMQPGPRDIIRTLALRLSPDQRHNTGTIMAFQTPYRLAAALVAVTLALGACSSSNQAATDQAYSEEPVAKLYNAAVDQLEQGNFQQAATAFDEVERQHPYSNWAVKAQVMAAYSLYMNNSYDEAIVALDRFVQFHPSNKDVPYVLYLKGLCYYEQISDVGRDQMMTELALRTFNELLTRYPNSEYARDAKLKVELTYDHLAGKEMDVGRWYQRRDELNAAINRFRTVVSDYQTTSHVPEALHRLVESYLALGLEDEAVATAAVLGYNFPGDRWYQDTYALLQNRHLQPEDRPNSWIGRVWNPIERVF